jgi:DNA-binding HxlR family transcriptional regulator
LHCKRCSSAYSLRPDRGEHGISPNVPTARLSKLVERGVPSEELYEAQPPRYEYTLTPGAICSRSCSP